MKVTVFVWKFVSEIADNQVLMRAAEYEDDSASDPETAAENAFEIFNAPEEILPPEFRELAATYHKRYPSLSIGDFVEAGGVKFQVKGIGWEKVDLIPEGKVRTMEERRNSLF